MYTLVVVLFCCLSIFLSLHFLLQNHWVIMLERLASPDAAAFVRPLNEQRIEEFRKSYDKAMGDLHSGMSRMCVFCALFLLASLAQCAETEMTNLAG